MINDVLQPLAVFGGIALVIMASARAKLMHRVQDMKERQPMIVTPQSDAVLAELRALKEQVSEMQSTGHQFDISFDAALTRMEGRVSRLETKAATASPTTPAISADATLRNGT